MKILVDNGSYALHNFGDVAMLQVAVSRLRDVFPDAELRVLSSSPELLSRCCPGASATPSNGLRRWMEWSRLPGRTRAPRALSRRFDAADATFRDRLPEWSDRLALRRARTHPKERADVETFLADLEDADLLVMAGGGYLNDLFRGHTRSCFELLSRLQRKEVPTAMVGQGIGPLRDRDLRERAKATLPGVGRIAVREGRSALPLLESVGVSRARIRVTGDDAIEPAFLARPQALGTGLGVNVRVSSYSEVGPDFLREMHAALRTAAEAVGAGLVPLPISSAKKDSDVESLRDLGADAAPEMTAIGLESPADVIRRVGECRVVVTGSYHAGVFALSQGIPVVGLSRSDYYDDKFLGLADQFGQGCCLVALDEAGTAHSLVARVRELWREADVLRPGLLAATERQVREGRAAYEELTSLVGARTGSAKRRAAPEEVAQ